MPTEDRYRPLWFLFFLSSQKRQRQIKGLVLEPSHYVRFRHGRTACTWRRVYLHRTSIAVSKPTPHNCIPGVRLPLHSVHSSPMKWSGGTRTASQVRADRSSTPVGEGKPVRPSTCNPRHEYFSPTEIGKVSDHIVKAARTAPQLFNNRFFYGRHGVRPPVEVSYSSWCPVLW